MTAFGTIDAREPVVQVSTFQEALDDVSGGGVRSPILRLSLQSRMGNGRPDTVTPNWNFSLTTGPPEHLASRLRSRF